MRWLFTTAIAALMMAGLSVGQTTNTDCMVIGNSIDCTSKTQSPPSFGHHSNPAPAQPSTGVSAEAMKEMLAEEKKAKAAKDTVDYLYCRQHANGSVTDYDGKPRTCADVIEYTKAFCLANPVTTEPWLPVSPEGTERCSLARSKAEVEKKFAVLADDFNRDPRRNKRDLQNYFDSLFATLTKWGCMSFPDMTLPQRDGTMHPCPDAPEPNTDAGLQKK
jgi:hypothetical protein